MLRGRSARQDRHASRGASFWLLRFGQDPGRARASVLSLGSLIPARRPVSQRILTVGTNSGRLPSVPGDPQAAGQPDSEFRSTAAGPHLLECLPGLLGKDVNALEKMLDNIKCYPQLQRRVRLYFVGCRISEDPKLVEDRSVVRRQETFGDEVINLLREVDSMGLFVSTYRFYESADADPTENRLLASQGSQ